MAIAPTTTKKPTRYLLNARSFPPGTPQEFKDVIFRVLDTLNAAQGTAITADGTATNAQETANGAQDAAENAQQGVDDLGGRVTTLESDTVSTSNTGLQTILGAFGIADKLEIDGDQVVGPRQTGWTANTGASQKGGAGEVSLPVGTTYTQAEIQAIANEVATNRHLLTAVIQAMLTHGLIGS